MHGKRLSCWPAQALAADSIDLRSGILANEGRMFFFEKKNQKTFVL
jgi:hypothetical protein